MTTFIIIFLVLVLLGVCSQWQKVANHSKALQITCDEQAETIRSYQHRLDSAAESLRDLKSNISSDRRTKEGIIETLHFEIDVLEKGYGKARELQDERK